MAKAPRGGKGPDQDEIEKQGKPYLDKGWPQLDSIKTAKMVAVPASRRQHEKTLPAKKTVPKADREVNKRCGFPKGRPSQNRPPLPSRIGNANN